MTFIETVPESDATGAVQEMYETDRASFGDLPNLTQAFSLRPEVYAAWRQLNGSIKAGMELRRYELATLGGRPPAALELLRARPRIGAAEQRLRHPVGAASADGGRRDRGRVRRAVAG